MLNHDYCILLIIIIFVTVYILTVNFSSNLIDQDFKFHLIRPNKFEEFAVAVVVDRYCVPFEKFKSGKGKGVDAIARTVNIDVGGGNVRTNKNVVVQVKHTSTEPNPFNDGTRKKVFGGEIEKVKHLVDNGLLHIYIIVTNYKLSFDQTEELKKMFIRTETTVGAEEVLVIGFHTLSVHLRISEKSFNELVRVYPPSDLKDLMDTPEAAQSMLLLDQYREDARIVDVEAFTKVYDIVKSAQKSLVFITGPRGCGKTTVAYKLVDQLDTSCTFYKISLPHDFRKNWYLPRKYIFLMDNMDCKNMKKWFELKDSVRIAIENGSKFVFVGQSVEFEKAFKGPGLHIFSDNYRLRAIDLSDNQYKLTQAEKKKILVKHVEMGDTSIKDDLLKDNIVSYAAEKESPCFPLVAQSLGSRDRLEQFKKLFSTDVYNHDFLDKFFEWVHSTSTNVESPPSKRRRKR